jgi:hypothetical protein
MHLFFYYFTARFTTTPDKQDGQLRGFTMTPDQ